MHSLYLLKIQANFLLCHAFKWLAGSFVVTKNSSKPSFTFARYMVLSASFMYLTINWVFVSVGSKL